MAPAESAQKKAVSTTFFPSGPPPVNRPRATGVTHVLDRLHGLIPAEIRPLAPYIDVVKLGWGLPLLLPREEVRARVKFYHDIGVEVSTGGTMLELAVSRDQSAMMMDEARAIGFDIIEVSDGVIELSTHQIEQLANDVRRRGLDVYIEVGKKNPQNQLSLRETLDRIRHALSLKPRKVIIESRGIRSGRGDLRRRGSDQVGLGPEHHGRFPHGPVDLRGAHGAAADRPAPRARLGDQPGERFDQLGGPPRLPAAGAAGGYVRQREELEGGPGPAGHQVPLLPARDLPGT